MLDLDEGFTQADPFELAKSWLKEAEAALLELQLHNHHH